MSDTPPDPELPIRPSAFAVLATLARGPLPGFEILERSNAAAPGRGLLGPGTLYRVLRELREDGLIEPVSPPREERGGDERRQYHALTGAGRVALAAEAARLRRLLDDAGLLWASGRSG